MIIFGRIQLIQLNGLKISKIWVRQLLLNLTWLIFIPKEILIDSVNYAKNYVEITDEQYQIILACWKTVLKNNDSTWIKTGLDNFNVPMGTYAKQNCLK